jgi:hypothetical protein
MAPNTGSTAKNTVIGLVFAFIALLWPVYQLIQATRPHPPAEKEARYYGYFRDINKDGAIYTGDEIMDLKFSAIKEANVKSVVGTSQGTVADEQGRKVERTWQIRGFRAGDKLVLTYFTAHDGTVSRSGVCYLKEYGQTFRGHWLSTDTFSGKDVLGSYILTPSKVEFAEAEKVFDSIVSPTDLLPNLKSAD